MNWLDLQLSKLLFCKCAQSSEGWLPHHILLLLHVMQICLGLKSDDLGVRRSSLCSTVTLTKCLHSKNVTVHNHHFLNIE